MSQPELNLCQTTGDTCSGRQSEKPLSDDGRHLLWQAERDALAGRASRKAYCDQLETNTDAFEERRSSKLLVYEALSYAWMRP